MNHSETTPSAAQEAPSAPSCRAAKPLNEPKVTETKQHAARRCAIVETARELYEEKGLSKTSVQNITDRIGITRTLFYHYFPDKEAVTSAVLDDYIADYLEALHFWNEERRTGDIEHALESVVKLLRLGVFEHDSFRLALASRENSALYLEFLIALPIAPRLTS